MTMRAFVTGATGFVGPYLRAHLEQCGDDVIAAAADFDVTDRDAVIGTLAREKPEVEGARIHHRSSTNSEQNPGPMAMSSPTSPSRASPDSSRSRRTKSTEGEERCDLWREGYPC